MLWQRKKFSEQDLDKAMGLAQQLIENYISTRELELDNLRKLQEQGYGAVAELILKLEQEITAEKTSFAHAKPNALKPLRIKMQQLKTKGTKPAETLAKLMQIDHHEKKDAPLTGKLRVLGAAKIAEVLDITNEVQAELKKLERGK